MNEKIHYTIIGLLLLVIGAMYLTENPENNQVLTTHEDNTSVQLTENISYSDYLTVCEGESEVLATKNASRCLSYFNQSIP